MNNGSNINEGLKTQNITSHIMRLHEEPFNMIKNGVKDIEYRLNDEKRQLIKIGDIITFYKRPEELEWIKAIVVDLQKHPDLLTMYTSTFEKDFKDRYASPQDVVDDTPYYTNDKVEKYGCLAIKIKKI